MAQSQLGCDTVTFPTNPDADLRRQYHEQIKQSLAVTLSRRSEFVRERFLKKLAKNNSEEMARDIRSRIWNLKKAR